MMSIKIKWGLLFILVLMGLWGAFAMSLTYVTHNAYVGGIMITLFALSIAASIKEYEE